MPHFSTNNVNNTTDDVSYTRQELVEILSRYEMINDCLEGEYAVKAKTKLYLPIPNSEKNSVSSPRYLEYLLRAVFYNVTQRTAEGLVGQIFLRNPTVELPTELQPMIKNTNGEGLDLNQLTKEACGHILAYGRGGLLTDFPRTDGTVTKEQLSSGEIQPTIKFYDTWDIINWETQIEDNRTVLSMLVLREVFEERKDGSFQVEEFEQFRVLELVDGQVRVRLYYRPERGAEFATSGEYFLLDSNQMPFTEIPFTFIGSENNDAEIDIPPLYTLAVLNIAHYRNSADYEENVYFMGQPTPFISGVTETWVTEMWDGVVQFGSRAIIPGPKDSKATLLQVQPNTLAKEAMNQKEQQMISVGAKLIERSANVERKEKEIEIEAASDISILTKIASNVESGMIRAFMFCEMFTGGDEGLIEFEINKNFDLTSLTAEELRQLHEIVSSTNPLMAWSEVRKILERSGFTYLTQEEALLEIEGDMKRRAEVEKMLAEAIRPPQVTTPNSNPTE